jgi:competence protein ComEA
VSREQVADEVRTRLGRVLHPGPGGTADADAGGDPPRPDPLTLARLDPGRAGLRVLAALAVAIALTAGTVAWLSRPDVEPLGGGPSAAASFGPPSAPAAPAIVVAVTGRVRRPGLLRLPTGARVADVLNAAGGVLPGTDISFLNLARKVSDGELIVVGVTPPPGAAPGGEGTGDGGARAGGPVNLNTAGLEQLQTLPGVGPVMAQRILDYRTAHGGFRSVADLRQVSGIGDARFAQLKDLVTV